MTRAFWEALKGFTAHRGFFLAAGLSFFLVVSTIPLLLVLVSVAGFVLSSEAAQQAVLMQLSQLVPVYRGEITRIVTRIISTRNVSGVLGTAVLLLFSTQFFAAARLVLGDIFGDAKGRGLVRGLLYDVLLIVVVGVLFLANVAVTLIAVWFKSWFLDPADIDVHWAQLMFLGLGLLFDTALFFMAYRYFPARRVPVGPAIAGAVLASVLWEVAKYLFRWYILSVGVYDAIYGTLGVLMALIMFTYYTGIVFILGAEYAAAVERRGRR